MIDLHVFGWRAVLRLSAAVAIASLYSCTAKEAADDPVSTQGSALTVDSVPCEAWSHAIIANAAGVVMVNSQSVVDSYRSSFAAYGGANVGGNAIIKAATSLTNNGGIIRGKVIAHSAAGLAVVPAPAGATNLPLGAASPGSLNVNDASGSITLAPGNYVAANINVNFPGSIIISPAGVVRIWVTGSLNLGGNENLNGIPSNLVFFVTSAGSVNVNSNGKLFGLIYAPTSTVNLNSAVFGSVVGSSVTLNSGAAVHFDENSRCDPSNGGGTPPSVASHPPRRLPLPPRTQGCYRGTANGWVAVPCAPSTSFKPQATSQTAIITPKGASATIPFQFAQFEQTFTEYTSEIDVAQIDGDVQQTDNSFTIQGNTVPFVGNNIPPGGNTPDTDWVQFAIAASTSGNAVLIQTWDVSQWNRASQKCPDNRCDISCGCTTYGMNTGPTRGSGFSQFDFSTVAGSVYNDVDNKPVLGMVAQFSWFDTSGDPNNFRGLYSVVAPDQYGLAGRWTDFSGAVLGAGSSSVANFTNTSVLHRTLAGSCVNGASPVDGIPWPGSCTGPELLPATTLGSVSPTGETNNLCQVGPSSALVAANSNLVFSQDLWSTSCTPAPTCTSNANRIFIRSTDEDTGARPINVGVQPFWESPDIFVVPGGAPVSVDGTSTETLITPGEVFDVYVRVNNDFGCSTVDGAQALVYLANPSTLSAQWLSITDNQYLGGAGGAGISVPAGGRALIGPFPFTAPTDVGDGHKCLLAAIRALPNNQEGPLDTTNPLASFQVGQRNVQFSNCKLPITNATTSSGNVTLTISAAGATPDLNGSNNLSVTFDDPNQVLFNAWQAGAGTAYSLTPAGNQTTVRLGQASVTLASVAIAAGQSITAAAVVSLGNGEPKTTLRVQATLKGATTVTNGLSCVGVGAKDPR